MMIDIHSHVLPGMDDGSASVKESIRMLCESARQGVRVMAATPHFYPAENHIEGFLRRREHAVSALRTAWEEDVPRVLPGAEVYYFEGMSRVQELDALKITGTDLLLLEMPFENWTDRMLCEIAKIQARPGITVLLAHIERYLKYQKNPGIWEELLEAGVKMQCNAEFFLCWRTRRKAQRMLRQGRIHIMGSDCHNMKGRPPCMGEAYKLIDSAGQKLLETSVRGIMPKMLEI